jgi:hypothetical protein
MCKSIRPFHSAPTAGKTLDEVKRSRTQKFRAACIAEKEKD